MAKRKASDEQFKEMLKGIDLETFRNSIRSDFEDFPDPRLTGRCVYPVWYLFLIILSGYLAGCNTVADIASFAEIRADWFDDLIERKVPAPSYSTIWWFLARVEPHAFKKLIFRWLNKLPKSLKDQLLVIDGKRLRGVSDNKHICHIVGLFAAEEQLTIAQEKVPEKAGETKALPALLDVLDVKGAIVSMDALYSHIGVIEQVLKREADYIVGIKGNQSSLEAEAHNFFEQAKMAKYEDIAGITLHETHDKGHGRIEKRSICVMNELDWLPQREKWHLQSLIEVRSKRVIGDKTENAIRYYGSSRKANARQFAKWIRGHWGIECMHHIIDVSFKEDECLGDVGYSAENMSLIRRLAVNVVKTYNPGRGMADARRSATYEPKYLRGLLGKMFVKSFL